MELRQVLERLGPERDPGEDRGAPGGLAQARRGASTRRRARRRSRPSTAPVTATAPTRTRSSRTPTTRSSTRTRGEDARRWTEQVTPEEVGRSPRQLDGGAERRRRRRLPSRRSAAAEAERDEYLPPAAARGRLRQLPQARRRATSELSRARERAAAEGAAAGARRPRARARGRRQQHEEAKLVDGVRLVHARSLGLLERGGPAEIAADGAFDPHVHEALLAQPAEAPRRRRARGAPEGLPARRPRAPAGAGGRRGVTGWRSDLYDTLGVSKTASADEIKKAYRKLARAAPPGREPGRRDGRGALQGGAVRLRRALRPGEAQAVRHLRRATGGPARRRRPVPERSTSATSTSATSSAGSSAGAAARGARRRAAARDAAPTSRRSVGSHSRTRSSGARGARSRSRSRRPARRCGGSRRRARHGAADLPGVQRPRRRRPTARACSRSRSRARAAAATAP